jgi:hypothetical protein
MVIKQTKTILMSNSESCYNMRKHRLFCHFLSIFASFFNNFSSIQNLCVHSSVHIPTVAFLWCYRKEENQQLFKMRKVHHKILLIKRIEQKLSKHNTFHSLIQWHMISKHYHIYIYALCSSPEKWSSVCESAVIMQNSLAMTNICYFSWWTHHPKHTKTWRQNVSMTVVWRYNFLKDTYFDINQEDSFDLRPWHLHFLCFWRMNFSTAFCFVSYWKASVLSPATNLFWMAGFFL